MEVLSYTYHPESPYYGKEGYYGFLTPQQEDDLENIEEWMKEQQIDLSDLCLNTLSSKLTLLRYLRANKFSVEKAKAHILRNLEWRAEMDVKGICSKTPDEILGCKLEDILALFPHWQSGNDQFGRPMIYKQYGATFDATKIFQISSKEAIARYHIWEQEACMRLCYETSKKTGYIVETVTCFIDIGGLNLSQVTRDFLAIIKLIAEIDQSQYPETLGRTFILNASSLFPMVWRMVKPWLDPVVANKIQILAGVESWHPYLLEHVGAEYLSSSYGGEAEYLDATVHPYAAIVYCESDKNTMSLSHNKLGNSSTADSSGLKVTITQRMLLEEAANRPVRRLIELHPRRSFGSDESKSISKVDSFRELNTSRVSQHHHHQHDNNDNDNEHKYEHDLEAGHSSTPSTILKYDLNSPYYDQTGYLGCLTEEQALALETLQNWIVDERVDISDLALNSLHPRLTLLRYLRATKFSVEKAIEKMKLNIEWRLKMNVKEIINMRPDEILGCEMNKLVEFFPHWQSGYDKHGRPVLYKQYNNHFDATKILQMSSTEAITRYHIWEQEACMRLCYEQSKKTNHIVETLTAVVDVKGMQLYQVTRDFLGIVKAIADIDQNHYPETLGQTFIINTPTVFPFVWRGVKPWLDPVVASKIQIFGQNESDWQSALFEHIGKSNMPSTYGGDLPNLDSNLHPYHSILETLPSGTDGKGLSIGDRMRLYDQHSHHSSYLNSRKKGTALGVLSHQAQSHSHENESNDSSSVCSSAFGDAIDGGDISMEYTGWDNEIQFLRSMVNDLNSDQRSDTSFEDCLEDHQIISDVDPVYQDVQQTLSSSILYSLYQRMKRFRLLMTSFYTMLLPKFLLKLSKSTLSKYLNYSVLGVMLISITCIGLSGYALSNMYWTSSSSLVRAQMWSSVVTLCLASIFTLLNFAGFVGSKTSNRPLLILFNCSLTAFFLIFLIIAMICFAFSTNNSKITGIRNEALMSVDSGQNISSLLQEYNLTLGTICTVLSLISLFPLTLSTCYCELLDRELHADEQNKLNRYSLDRRLYEQTQQLRVVVRIAQMVAIIIALPMIGYGASALHYLLKIQFDYSVFAVYCLLYSGITSLLASFVGIWSSFTSQLSILKFYLYLVMPIHVILLLGTGLENVILFPHVISEFNHDSDNLNIPEENHDVVGMLLQIQLLVGGVLSLTAVFFQFVCLFCVVSYFLRLQQIEIIAKKRELERNKLNKILYESGKITEEEYLNSLEEYTTKKILTRNDKLIIVWSLLIGLIHIYLGGTFAMFAYRVVESDNTWMVAIWNHIGRYDSRYVTADGFLISTKGLLALFVGPLFLVYAWTITTGHNLRPFIGILVNSLEMYTQILYFAMEIQNHFANISLSGPIIFTIGFILNDLLRTIISPLIVWEEVNVSMKHRNHQQPQQSQQRLKDHYYSPSHEFKSMTSSSSPSSPSEGLNWARYLSLRNRK